MPQIYLKYYGLLGQAKNSCGSSTESKWSSWLHAGCLKKGQRHLADNAIQWTAHLLLSLLCYVLFLFLLQRFRDAKMPKVLAVGAVVVHRCLIDFFKAGDGKRNRES